jgi:hypothetical protein
MTAVDSSAFIFVVVSRGLRLESPWMQIILWGQFAGKVRVLSDLCEGSVLHGPEVYLTGIGIRSGHTLKLFFVIKKKIK